MENLGFMTAAYTVIWIAILVYFLSLSKREKAIWEELQNLRTSITRGETQTEEA